MLYLNVWEPGDGGEFCVYPLTRDRVNIEPIFGRAVLFSSQKMLHRTLEQMAPHRFAVCLWFTSDADKEKAEGSNVEEPLLSDKNYKQIVKLVHAPEWRESIGTAHAESEDLNGYISRFDKEVSMIERTFSSRAGELAGIAEEAKNLRWFPTK